MGVMVFVLFLIACSQVNLLSSVSQEAIISFHLSSCEVASKLSRDLGISANEIKIIYFEQIDWPDACLGMPQEGQACAQIITPGYLVKLEVNGEEVEFRSDLDGKLIRMAMTSGMGSPKTMLITLHTGTPISTTGTLVTTQPQLLQVSYWTFSS
jgi:hypothetical protein